MMDENKDEAIVYEGQKLQEKITVTGTGDEIGTAAIERAAKALDGLSDQFEEWIVEQTARLAAARDNVEQSGYSGELADELFRAAHDLKGEADTFGYPLVTRIGASLCYLLEAVEKGTPFHNELVNLHVDAVRAIVRDHIKGQANSTAVALFTSLAEATDSYVTAHPSIKDEGADESGSERETGSKPLS